VLSDESEGKGREGKGKKETDIYTTGKEGREGRGGSEGRVNEGEEGVKRKGGVRGNKRRGANERTGGRMEGWKEDAKAVGWGMEHVGNQNILPSFLHIVRLSYLLSFLHSFLPSFLPSFI
jgi:hypothetical protein